MRHAQIERLREIRREVELNRDNLHLPTESNRRMLLRINDVLFDLVETLLMECEGMHHMDDE